MKEVYHDIIIVFIEHQVDIIHLIDIVTTRIIKNLVGNIIVNDKGDFIREYIINGKKVRNRFEPYCFSKKIL